MSEPEFRSGWTDAAVKWADVYGMHERLHFLRRAAIVGARALIEEVGIDESASYKFVHSLRKPNGRRSLRGWETEIFIGRQQTSKLIPLGERDTPDKSGLNYEFARVREVSGRVITAVYPSLLTRVQQAIEKPEDKGPKFSAQDTRNELSITKVVGDKSPEPRMWMFVPDAGNYLHLPEPDFDFRFPHQLSADKADFIYQEGVQSIFNFMDQLEELSEIGGNQVLVPLRVREQVAAETGNDS